MPNLEKVGQHPAVLRRCPATFRAIVSRSRTGSSTGRIRRRVTVNRMWQNVLAPALESAGDFGTTRTTVASGVAGLARGVPRSGWVSSSSLMVTSATYRQSAVVPPALLERDSANRLLARGPRYRLDAEQLRDQVLAASGLLVTKLGGRPVRPYQPEGIWEDVAMKQSTTRYYRVDLGDNLYRRSLYTIWKRTAPPPAMDILNAPSREVSCVRRDRTNTPLQASSPSTSRFLSKPPAHSPPAHSTVRRLRCAPRCRFAAPSRPHVHAERAVVRRTLDGARPLSS